MASVKLSSLDRIDSCNEFSGRGVLVLPSYLRKLHAHVASEGLIRVRVVIDSQQVGGRGELAPFHAHAAKALWWSTTM